MNKQMVLHALSRHIGQDKGVSAGRLVDEINGRGSLADEHDMRVLRRLITELRLDGHHICAHPATGYFMAQTDAELDTTCEFLYQRAIASLQQVAAMKHISLPDLRGQLRLPLN